ncbi:hypothetical protein [Dyella terrae]|uniref:hypothetical protein n=1 Tax=Dyella terrae TaxID=522259 RepID=UPI001EFD193B|nr:hypothetical protein [Dyella terrae]
MPVPAYRPVDDKLTAPIAEPNPPASNCTYLGVPAVCLIDALLWVEDWRGKLEEANSDRATTKTITTPQP